MSNELSPRGEFWQILARSLLLPRGEFFSAALREDLADDLDDLASELGLDLGNTVSEFSAAALALPDAESLLVAYSRLFLTPPIPCRLTLGWHLDGTLLGPSVKALRDVMARHGVAQTEGLKETPDVLPTVMEFVALLLQRLDASQDAEQRAVLEKDLAILRTHYLGATLSQMVRLTESGEDDYELPPVYSRLLKIIEAALDDPLAVFFVPLAADAEKARPRYFAKRDSAADLVCCKSCGKSVASERELRVIIDRLQQAGLPADHLELCPDCREVGMGWKPGTPKMDIPGFR